MPKETGTSHPSKIDKLKKYSREKQVFNFTETSVIMSNFIFIHIPVIVLKA